MPTILDCLDIPTPLRQTFRAPTRTMFPQDMPISETKVSLHGSSLLPLLAGYLSSGGRVVGNFGAANPDVGMGTSKASTAIWHTGFDAKPGTLEANLMRRSYAPRPSRRNAVPRRPVALRLAPCRNGPGRPTAPKKSATTGCRAGSPAASG